MPRSTSELLAELFEFLRIPSISSGDGEPTDLLRAAEWVAARVRDAGGEASVIPTSRNPIALGTIRCGLPDAPHVLVYGHYDVQTVHPLEAWTSAPFEPVIRDGAIWARGASDDKGNFHCVLAALIDLVRDGQLAVDVTVVSDGEEEIGGDSVVRWLERQTETFAAAIVFDSSLVEDGWPMICTGVRGVLTGMLRVQTGARDVHSGLYGGVGLNAAHVLATLIEGTRARDGRLVDALTVGVVPPTAEEVASWASLPAGARELAAAGIAPLDAAAATEFYLRTFALPTFDVTAITCRDASQTRTIIPHEATAAISLRLVPDQGVEQTSDAFEAHVRSLLPPGAALELTWRGRSAGCAYDPTLPPIAIAREAFAEVFGHECALARSGGAIPLVSALHQAGITAIVTGVGLPSDNIHAPDEHLAVARYELGVRVARRLLERLAELPGR